MIMLYRFPSVSYYSRYGRMILTATVPNLLYRVIPVNCAFPLVSCISFASFISFSATLILLDRLLHIVPLFDVL